MYDYHVHTAFSMDCTMDMEAAIERGVELGIQEIAFTDHAELNVETPGGTIEDSIFDIETYIAKIQEVREKYKNKISIKLGVEIGLQVEEKDRIDDLIYTYPFDFVIGSSHTIERQDLYYRKLYQNKTKEEAYQRYFEEILRIVKEIDSYSVYGHLDLVRRYARDVYKEIELNNQELEVIRAILKEIIHKGKGIEVNTSGFRYGIHSTNPGIEVLKLYRELGGEIITVGSDAHKKEHLGFKIQDTYEILKKLGYQYITTFDQRTPKFHRL